MEYPEKAVSVVCSPTNGLASKLEFFPSLAKLKSALDDAAFDIKEHERRVRQASMPPPQQISAPQNKPASGCYTGPIELVKPGDILDQSRFDEYRQFMRTQKNMPVVKLWGVNENWVDSQQRPFQISSKPDKHNTTNPFL